MTNIFTRRNDDKNEGRDHSVDSSTSSKQNSTPPCSTGRSNDGKNNGEKEKKSVFRHFLRHKEDEEKIYSDESATSSKDKSKECCGSSTYVSGKEPPFQSSLTRILKNDYTALEKYVIIDHIGSGSTGSIELVQKKESAIGGSAYESQEGKLDVFGIPILHGRKHVTPPEHRFHDRSSFNYLYAMKTIHLDRISQDYLDELKNEIAILRSLDHPHIVKAYELYETKKQMYIVMEFCNGGDLYSRAPYSEDMAQHIIVQLMSAVRYLHAHHVVHRDLKFENILFENKQSNCIKVIDFGISKKFIQGTRTLDQLRGQAGTLYTVAPEVLKGVYSSQADMWSVGVIAYMLLSGTKPFFHTKMHLMLYLIKQGNPSFTKDPIWESIDPVAIDFVRKLIVVDTEVRMTAAEASHHEYIRNYVPPVDNGISTVEEHTIDNCLRNYKETSSIKKLALNVIAHNSTATDICDLRQVFESFDKESDGILSYEEFGAALQQTNLYTEDDICEIFTSIDVNKNGHIMYTEFLAATLEAHGYIAEDKIAEAFNILDRDESGYITKKDIMQALGSDRSMSEVKQFIKDADYDHDGKISFAEFLRHFRETTQAKVSSITKMDGTESDENSLVI